jgi:hypothetical protein
MDEATNDVVDDDGVMRIADGGTKRRRRWCDVVRDCREVDWV